MHLVRRCDIGPSRARDATAFAVLTLTRVKGCCHDRAKERLEKPIFILSHFEYILTAIHVFPAKCITQIQLVKQGSDGMANECAPTRDSVGIARLWHNVWKHRSLSVGVATHAKVHGITLCRMNWSWQMCCNGDYTQMSHWSHNILVDYTRIKTLLLNFSTKGDC